MPDAHAQPGEAARLGLCSSCRHARRIESARGSEFLLCQLSASDPRYPKYPRLPVKSCTGFAAIEPTRKD